MHTHHFDELAKALKSFQSFDVEVFDVEGWDLEKGSSGFRDPLPK